VHLPAVQVTVAKAEGLNHGPIQMFFAPIPGIGTLNLSARAVAVISRLVTGPAGGGPPSRPVKKSPKISNFPPDICREAVMSGPGAGANNFKSVKGDADAIGTSERMAETYLGRWVTEPNQVLLKLKRGGS
jgi:hypothetical protein